MELPDVIEKYPVADPEAHDLAFEANFAELARWVADIHLGRAFDPGLLSQMLDGQPARELGAQPADLN